MQTINIGDVLTCAETGVSFIAAKDGCSFNYAHGPGDEIVSDAGVDIRERRELSHRSRPFTCYLSSDGANVTGWRGNVLGRVIASRSVRLTRTSYTHGMYMQAVRVRDVHGGEWYGRGSPGICITLRACKTD